MKTRQPYKMRPTIGDDDEFRLKDGTPWFTDDSGKDVFCRICGHHLPSDQVVQVGDAYIHSDNVICLALILRGGNKGLAMYPENDAQLMRNKAERKRIERGVVR